MNDIESKHDVNFMAKLFDCLEIHPNTTHARSLGIVCAAARSLGYNTLYSKFYNGRIVRLDFDEIAENYRLIRKGLAKNIPSLSEEVSKFMADYQKSKSRASESGGDDNGDRQYGTGHSVDTISEESNAEEDSAVRNDAAGILSSAAEVMDDRAEQYDQEGGERSMDAAIGAFNAITGKELLVSDGYLLMAMLKYVRSQTASRQDAIDDCIHDNVAYAALYGEYLRKERKEDGE